MRERDRMRERGDTLQAVNQICVFGAGDCITMDEQKAGTSTRERER